MSSITFPGPIGQGIIVAWRGRGRTAHIYYKFRTASFHKGRWSKPGVIPGPHAVTESAAAITAYTDPLGRSAVLAVWTGPRHRHIWYSQGETRGNGTIAWTGPAVLPKTVLYTNTIDRPAAFVPSHKNVALVAWRGPANHVRYAIGTPHRRGFTWSKSTVVPGSPVSPVGVHCTSAPCTSATPAIAEASTGTAKGTLYMFWKQYGTRHLFYASTPDPLTISTRLAWTAPVMVPGAITLTGPAASVIGINGFGPLLLVYKAAFTTHVRFQTLTGGTWSASSFVPRAYTDVTPGLLRGLLATTTPTLIGNITLHVFS
ncbi:MAG TPA: hypothetical protein VNF47_22990 [Streptosporangiaceae bacterium]|nr:hypothetical protein [Streptosporangiaceae bacterium]